MELYLNSLARHDITKTMKMLDNNYLWLSLQVVQLPPELSNMDQLKTLLLQGLPLTDPPFFVVKEGPQAVLHYLSLKLNSSPWSSLRVVVLGPQFSGKTTLISKITGTSPNADKALDVSYLHLSHDITWHVPCCSWWSGSTEAVTYSPSAEGGSPLTFGISVVNQTFSSCIPVSFARTLSTW